MLKNLKWSKTQITAICLCLLMVLPALIHAKDLKSGIRGCGGNHFKRTDPNEAHTTKYTLRNYNLTETLLISVIVIFDGNGSILFSGLPGGTFKSRLAPAQSTSFTSGDVLESFLPESDQPIQTYIVWQTESGNLAESLGGGCVRRVRDITTKKEISRHHSDCRNLELF